jgi:hypothetical protein
MTTSNQPEVSVDADASSAKGVTTLLPLVDASVDASAVLRWRGLQHRLTDGLRPRRLRRSA